MKTVVWREGKVEVEVPDPSLYPPTEKSPVFFNPRARVSRDLSTLVVKALSPPQIADVMAGTGIRGLRYAVESGVENIVLNDVNPVAIELAKKNAARLGIDAELVSEDANVLLHTRRFAGIDLDPFGSPSPFLQATARSVVHSGIFLITATDTSPLAGSSPNAAVRKYHVNVRKLPWFRELAVRVLWGYVQHHLMVWEKAAIPVFSFFAEHHVRVVGKVVKKPSFVSRCAEMIRIVDGVGPIWTGPLHDRDVVKTALRGWDEDYTKASRKILEIAAEEIDVVGYHNLHFLAKELGVSVPPIDDVLTELKRMGYAASRSSLEFRAVKTDAPKEVVKEVVECLGRSSST